MFVKYMSWLYKGSHKNLKEAGVTRKFIKTIEKSRR